MCEYGTNDRPPVLDRIEKLKPGEMTVLSKSELSALEERERQVDYGKFVERLVQDISSALAIPVSPVMTTVEAAEYLSVEPQTLAKWRLEGSGPPYAKRGKWIRYRKDRVDEWLLSLER